MTDVHEPRPGQTIAGRYLVESELGRGGFGVVFRGRHLEVDRPVAIKVLLRTFAAAETTAVERFRREAVLAASLTYPNTVQVYDYGETDEGVFFIVMELLNGRPLAEVLAAEGPLAPRRAVHIVEQALFTLMEAHSEGIVHRDIKPDNIMLTPLAFDPDFVKVMDFGIAKMSGATGRDLTGHGITLGTPRYMPVEQLSGNELTPATDLYAVGLVLYEMLVGRPAFKAESTVDIAVEVLQGPGVSVDPVESGVPPGLCRIIERACRKRAEDRYQSAEELLDALRAWLVEAPPGLATWPRAAARQTGAAEPAKTLMLDAGTGGATSSAAARTQLLEASAAGGVVSPTLPPPAVTAIRSAMDHGGVASVGPAPRRSVMAPDGVLLRVMLGMQGLAILLLLTLVWHCTR